MDTPQGEEASPSRPRAEDLNLIRGKIDGAPEFPVIWRLGTGKHRELLLRWGGLPAPPHQILGPRLGDGVRAGEERSRHTAMSGLSTRGTRPNPGGGRHSAQST